MCLFSLYFFKVLLTLIKMEMFNTSLKPILLHSSSEYEGVNDFELSVSVESIIAKLKGNEPSPILIHGEPGCGLTTLLLGICKTLVESSWLEKSDMLSFRVRPGCSMQSVWSFLSEIAKAKHDKDTASLLLQSSTKLCKKNEAAQKFIASHFKLICVDYALADGGVVWSYLSKLFFDINMSLITVSSVLQTTQTEQSIMSVELKGVGKESYKKLLEEQLPNWNFDDDKLSRIHSVLNGNPSSLKVFLNAVKEFNLPQDSVDCGFLVSSVNCNDQQEQQSTVFNVIEFLLKRLTFQEKNVFYELCLLREELPIIHVPEEVETLVRLGLVRKEVIAEATGTNNGSLHALSVSSCFCISSLPRNFIADNNGQSPAQIPKNFSVFNLWFALLSVKLRQLIMDAQRNAWPFVPEKW